ncbi:MAG TPA: phosphatase PAP2 family protein [Polyangia bacterium]|nr:phosphatase PAP2 family protein [Polyangia bacterium]
MSRQRASAPRAEDEHRQPCSRDALGRRWRSGSALVGVARVEAGSHFPSDVLVGAAVGTSFGLAVPALHTLNLQATALAGPQAGPQTSGLAVTDTF